MSAAAAVVGCALVAFLFVVVITLRLYLGRAVQCKNRRRLDGKVTIVTGASSGIGREVATECARRGAVVILACRNRLKTESAVADIRRKTSNDKISFLELDLASLQSVENFWKEFLRRHDNLDFLVNNAAYLGPKEMTVDGFDLSFQVNFLSQFHLTNLFIRHFVSSGRHKMATLPFLIVNMASDSYVRGDATNFENFMWNRLNYDIYGVYGDTKLAVIMFTLELTRRYSQDGVISLAVHPGAVKTGLMDNWPGLFGYLLRASAGLLFRSPLDGAQSIIHCLTADNVGHLEGKLVVDCRPTEIDDVARNQKQSESLWKMAEELCQEFQQKKRKIIFWENS